MGISSRTVLCSFSQNRGRIAEISRCDDQSYDNVALSVRACSIKPTAFAELPPEGPYLVVLETFLTRMDRLLRDVHQRKLGAEECRCVYCAQMRATMKPRIGDVEPVSSGPADDIWMGFVLCGSDGKPRAAFCYPDRARMVRTFLATSDEGIRCALSR